MTSRRTFLISATAAASLYLVGCKERVKVLKFPESAEEVADLMEFFTAKSFTFDQAVAGLGITGEGRSFDSTSTWRRTTFPKQDDLIESIGFTTSNGELESMSINYTRPIRVSLGRLESMLGTSEDHSGPVVGQLRSVRQPMVALTKAATNGSGDRNRGSFEFRPEKPISPEHYKGTLRISCKYSDDNMKDVTDLMYDRRLPTQ